MVSASFKSKYAGRLKTSIYLCEKYNMNGRCNIDTGTTQLVKVAINLIKIHIAVANEWYEQYNSLGER